MLTLDNLKDIYNDINEWLKFAEAKNIALTTFYIFIITVLVDAHTSLNNGIFITLLSSSIVGLIISLISFTPFLTSFSFIRSIISKYAKYKSNATNTTNLVFYVNIVALENSSNTWTSTIQQSLQSPIHPLSYSYINQIIATSSITTLKCLFFNISLIAFFSINVLFAIFLLICA